MEKLIYLIFQEAALPGSELRATLLEEATPALRTGGAREITVHVQDEAVADGTPMRRSDPPIRAMVSFWMHNADDRGPCEGVLAEHARRLAGYLVVESRPLVHEAPKGRRTPGMNQVTCITKKPDLDYDEFLRIWQQDHKVVAIETQSTVGYVRNVIVRKLTEGAPNWDAIIEETFPIGALTDPRVFYDAKSEEELKRNSERMIESCQRFLDFEPLEYTHMSEYYLG
jgi:hypothetical protein